MNDSNVIGQGTYGTVYCVRMKKHDHSNELVALKRLVTAPDLYMDGCDAHCREIEILLQCGGRFNIPKLYTIGYSSISGRLSLVMELFQDNQPFDKYGLSMSETECKQYIMQLLRALKHVHEHGYVHRDVRPNNYLCNYGVNGSEWKFMLVDFGLGASIEDLSVDCKRSFPDRRPRVMRRGSRGWRAPEILLLSDCQDSRIDTWNVGVILATIITQAYPLFQPLDDAPATSELIRVFGFSKVKDVAAKAYNRRIDEYVGGFSSRRSAMAFYHSPVYQYGRFFCKRQMEKAGVTSLGGMNPFQLQREYISSNEVELIKCWRKCSDWSVACFDLLSKLLALDYRKRLKANEALNHKWFK